MEVLYIEIKLRKQIMDNLVEGIVYPEDQPQESSWVGKSLIDLIKSRSLAGSYRVGSCYAVLNCYQVNHGLWYDSWSHKHQKFFYSFTKR